MLIPLWKETSDTPQSAIFTVIAGEVAALFATGFARERTRTSQADIASPQFACLHRINTSYSQGSTVVVEPTNACDVLSSFSSMVAVLDFDEIVHVKGCALGLSQCDNVMYLSMPGTYYFELNDTTAIGKAQIWLEMFKAKDLPGGLL